MRRRPICCLCLILMLVIVLLDKWEFPLWRETPISVPVQEYLKEHPKARVLGTVSARTKSETSTSIYLKDSKLINRSETYSLGNIRVFLKTEQKPPVGARAVVFGKLERTALPRNPGGFDSRQYYQAQNIYYLMYQGEIEKVSEKYSPYGEAMAWLQERLGSVLERIAGQEAGVLRAMVLGDKSGLDQETKIRYQMAGIIHMLAISGLHLSLLGMGLFQLLKKAGLGNGAAGAAALGVIFQYGIFTGGSVATLRAVTMFLLSVGGKILGRTYDMLTAMAFAAILLLLESPDYLYNSGFLLSFGAVLGMGVTAPALLEGVQGSSKVFKGFLSSMAVQLTTLPILLYFYYEVSVYGILLNLLVIPTLGAALGLGLGGMAAGCVWQAAGGVIIWPARLLLRAYEFLCALGCRLPFCTWIGGQPRLWQMGVYYVILGICVWVWKRGGFPERGLWIKVLPKAGCILAIAGAAALLGYRGHGTFTITCLDVGQGDGIVMEVPGEGVYLCDGGSSSQSQVGTYEILPFIKSRGIKVLNGIFVSHTDNDHISGIEEILEAREKNLTAVQVKCLYLPWWEEKPEAYVKLEKLAKRAKVPVKYLCQGNQLQGKRQQGKRQQGKPHQGKQFSIQVLYPPQGKKEEDINENCLVFQVKYGEFTGLFTGDAGKNTEKELLPLLKQCQFLKTGHHGSKNSTGAEFLDKVRPLTAVISCSATNRYGHPAPETLERLEEAGARVWITKDCGAVTLSIQDGSCRVIPYLGHGSA